VEVCKMLKLAKAAILGIICLDVHKLLFSPNHPTLANPKNRLDLNMPLSSLLAKKFLHFGWTKRKTLVGENTTLFSWHIDRQSTTSKFLTLLALLLFLKKN
jgi:hypothetical protein